LLSTQLCTLAAVSVSMRCASSSASFLQPQSHHESCIKPCKLSPNAQRFSQQARCIGTCPLTCDAPPHAKLSPWLPSLHAQPPWHRGRGSEKRDRVDARAMASCWGTASWGCLSALFWGCRTMAFSFLGFCFCNADL
jgi:hypothetical protein